MMDGGVGIGVVNEGHVCGFLYSIFVMLDAGKRGIFLPCRLLFPIGCL